MALSAPRLWVIDDFLVKAAKRRALDGVFRGTVLLVRSYAHQFNSHDASCQVQGTVAVLEHVLQEVPYLFWPEKSVELPTRGGLSAQKEKQLRQQEGLQSLYNMWLRQELVERGFEAEVPVRDVRQSCDGQKVDFARLVAPGLRVFAEVEFGYTASIERNLFKLLDAYHHDRSVLGVMICPVAALAKAIASGVAAFETAVERLQSFHPKTFPAPLLVLGLDHRGAVPVDMSRSKLPGASSLSGNKSKEVLWHVASELRAGVCVDTIGLPEALARKHAIRDLKLRHTECDLQGQLAF